MYEMQFLNVYKYLSCFLESKSFLNYFLKLPVSAIAHLFRMFLSLDYPLENWTKLGI